MNTTTISVTPLDCTQSEQELQAKGLNAPRITPEHVDSVIANASYHVFENTCLTVCCLTLKNGFTATGESACASPENFDAEIGRQIAYKKAREKVWELEGYLLKQSLFNKSQTTPLGLMKVEQTELATRLKALNEFLDQPQPSSISLAEWERLHEQRGLMTGYNNVLSERIKLFV